MNFFSISYLFTAIISLFGGIFIYFKNKKALLNQIWAKMSLAVFFWSLSLFCVITSTKENTALFWQYLLDVSAIFIPTLFFHFTLAFLNLIQERRFKIQLWIIYSLGLALALFSFTPFFKIGVAPILEFNFWVIPGPLYILFPLFFLSIVLYSFYLFIKNYSRASEITKLQIKYILLAGLIGFGGGATNFLPQFADVPPVGNYLVSLYIVIIILTITRYHLFEIRVILTELLVGVMGIVLLIQIFIAETFQMKAVGLGTFLLFCIFGYFLIKATHQEIKRREEMEKLTRELQIAYGKLEKTTNELKESYKNIKALSEVKSEFLKIVNHQLRTPVSIVMSYLSLLQEGSIEGEEKIKKTISNTYLTSQRLVIILDDLLNAQELIGEKPILNVRFCQIEEIIKEAIKRFELFIAEKKLILSFQKSKESLPLILLDRDRIERAVKKLVDNAILYTPKGKITIFAHLIKEDEKKFAQIQIKDTGIGIIEEDKKKLFKPFSRGEEGLKMHPNGSGLGLFIAKENIEAHQGKIKVESEGKNKGTTFTITLPIDTEI